MADRAGRDGNGGGRVRPVALLLALTLAITSAFHLLAVPAAPLLGPMVAGIATAARGRPVALPRAVATGSQAVVGCLIASNLAGALGPVLVEHGLLFAGLTAATVAASGALGYALSRLGIVPGTVAIWGSMPGGAAAMVLMAEADGADARLVAVMVYTRVVTVTVIATLLAAALGTPASAPVAGAAAHTAPLWPVALVAAGGIAAARATGWPAGTLVLTMAIGIGATWAGIPAPAVPAWLLLAAFTALGWRIGLSFTGDARGAAFRMLPRIVAAALLLAAFCGALAAFMHLALGIDPLTAWLAASPGGLESVAVIAGSVRVDAPFVMAAQTGRFGLVMLVGPALASALARRGRLNGGDAR